MTDVVLCPNCGGQKTVSKPSYIAGDVNSWVDSGTPTYSCPTCDGRGWINVDSVPREDFVAAKSIALSSMETSEALMDECGKRGDRIKELETDITCLENAAKGFRAMVGEKDLRIANIESLRRIACDAHNHRKEELEAQVRSLTEYRDRLERVNTRLIRNGDKQYDALREHVAYTHLIESERDSTILYLTKEHNNNIGGRENELKRMIVGARAADEEIERLRTKIFDIEGREDLVTAELKHRACVAEDELSAVKEMRDELLEDWENKRGEVAHLKTIVHELEADEVCLNSSIKAFRAVIGEKDIRIADLMSQRDIVRKMHNTRGEELLVLINGLTGENKPNMFDR